MKRYMHMYMPTCRTWVLALVLGCAVGAAGQTMRAAFADVAAASSLPPATAGTRSVGSADGPTTASSPSATASSDGPTAASDGDAAPTPDNPPASAFTAVPH